MKTIILLIGLIALLLFVSGCTTKPSPTSQCSDSDGNNIYEKGTVTGKYTDEDKPRSLSDSCFDSKTLSEYYCKGNYEESALITCKNGCNDGKCIPDSLEECASAGERKCFGSGYKVCENKIDSDGKKYLDWGQLVSCTYSCENGICTGGKRRIECQEEVKNSLCGTANEILPIANYSDGSEFYFYSSGVYENTDFKVAIEYPEKVIAGEEFSSKLTITNKQNTQKQFNYEYYPCTNCHYEIIGIQKTFLSTPEKTTVTENFLPNETKTIEIGLKATQPTLTTGDIAFFTLQYDDKFINLYSYAETPGQWDSPTTVCNNRVFPKTLFSTIAMDGSIAYGIGVCCDNVFYPSAECCTDDQCTGLEGYNGYCVDGKCIRKNNNKLYGEKRILYIDTEPGSNACEEIPITPSMNDFILGLDSYYDAMASKLLSKNSNFVNFRITKAIRVPTDFVHHFDLDESGIISNLSSACGINPSDFDIIAGPLSLLLPDKNPVEGGDNGGGVTLGKVVLIGKIWFEENNPVTLIHETGHVYGCSDLYFDLGGRLQWQSTEYGLKRNVTGGVDDLINKKQFDLIPTKAYAVCRGELGWTDLNENGIVDVLEE